MPTCSPASPGRSATLVECDYALEKPRCDVLLNGAAYAPGGRPVERIAVGLQVGAWRKSFVVWGNREWRRAGVGYAPSEPEPFERMPISYDNAFGGTDERMRDPAQVRSYLPNPVGRGWHMHIYPELVIGAPVSNTEEIRDPVRDPGGKYRPMAFGPIGRGWPSRIRYAGTYDQNWIDNVFPFLPDDFDSRYFQCAPEDQQIAAPAWWRAGAADQPDAGRTARICAAVGRNADRVLPSSRRSGGDERHARHAAVRAGCPSGSAWSGVRACKLQRDIFEVSQVAGGTDVARMVASARDRQELPVTGYDRAREAAREDA